MVAIPEHVLLKKAREFDLDILADIYDTYSDGIYRYAVRLIGNQDLAEECVAETFNRLLVAFKNGGGPKEHLQAYLYRIAHNWITDQFRRKQPVELTLDEKEAVGSSNANIKNMDPIFTQQIRTALFRLTPEQRQVIVLKFVEGKKNEDIARSLNKPVGAVKALQHRAVGALRRLLLPLEGADDTKSE